MALTSAVHESLPYIDREPTLFERSAAQSLIDAELSSSSQTPTEHPNLPTFAPIHLSSLVEVEHLRISRGEKLAGIDVSRYEALSPPEDDAKGDEALDVWRKALAQAYTSKSYLSGRVDNLMLLERFGKNAWLISNSQQEDILRGLERELSEAKTAIDVLAVERRNAQEAVGGEIRGLDEGWRRGVGRVLETEVAAEGVRRDILERRRGGA